MKQLLVTVKDKTKINEMEKYGHVTYVSPYTTTIGFECPTEKVPLLEKDQNVLGFEDAETGKLQV